MPTVIAAGLDDVSKRTEWNKTASAEWGLPTETWREVVARRKRYEEVRAKLVAGEVTQINDLITLNLDIRQFAQDVLATYEGSDLIAAFYRAIAGRVPEKSNEEFEQGLSVLDPTCGSGAFLFAALNVLEPLVETCIERMRSFVEEADRQGRNAAHLPHTKSESLHAWLSGVTNSLQRLPTACLLFMQSLPVEPRTWREQFLRAERRF